MSGWCCLQPPKIPCSYHASLVCLHSLSQINLLSGLSTTIQHRKIIRPLLRFMCVYNIDEFTKSPLWQYFIEQHSIPQECCNIWLCYNTLLRYIVFLLTGIIITVTWWHDCTRLKRFKSVNNEWHKSFTHYHVLAHTCTKTHMAHLCIDYSCFGDLRDV